ncbi:hypothetical protein AMTRI_Chr02g219240 [Amborella trichopoda]
MTDSLIPDSDRRFADPDRFFGSSIRVTDSFFKPLELTNELTDNLSKNEEIEFDNLLAQNNIDKPESSEVKQKPQLNLINRLLNQKWYTLIKIIVQNEYTFQSLALIDSGDDLNCINERLVPIKYFDKTTQILNKADGSKLCIHYKLSNAAICNNGIRLELPFIMVKGLNQAVILGTPFISMLYPIVIDHTGLESTIEGIKVKFELIDKPRIKEINNVKQNIQNEKNFLYQLKAEIKYKTIEEHLLLPEIKTKIEDIKHEIEKEICSELPTAFWNRQKHIVSLPYEEGFSETKIPTKVRRIQMNSRMLEICHKEIKSLLEKRLIRPSSSPWSCVAFYVENNAEKERGVPRLVINYKPLNKVLKWIRYPIHYKNSSQNSSF